MRRRRWVIAGAVLTLVIVVFLLWPGDPEPEYEGKKLSQWVTINGWNAATFGNTLYMALSFEPTASQPAPVAIRAIGTNALPFLLKWIQYEPPRWRMRLMQLASRLPAGIQSSRFVMWAVSSKREMLAENAIDAFRILGPQSAEAIPELGRLMKEKLTSAPLVSFRATRALHSMNPAMVGLLTYEPRGPDLPRTTNSVPAAQVPAR